jgi:ABC-type sugar transport system permease subunit
MRRKTFYAFTGPSIVLMLTLMIIPLIMAVWLGLHYVTYRNMNAPEFVGLENYQAILADPRFWQSLRFTLLIIAIVTPAEMILGFFVALLLDQTHKGVRGIFISLLLTTYVTVPVVSGLMFRQLFEPNSLGAWLIEEVMGSRFVLTPTSVKTMVMLYGIWRDTPFCIIVLFAGLQTLSMEQLEAAQIDGANRWQQLRYITLAHLKPLLILIAMIVIMDKYRIFDAILVLTNMNPVYGADTLMLYNWRIAVEVQRLGKANAMSVLTVIGIMVVLIPFLYRTYGAQKEER